MARDIAAIIKDLEEIHVRMAQHNAAAPKLLHDPAWAEWSAKGDALQKEADAIWTRGLTPEEASHWQTAIDSEPTITFNLKSGEILGEDGTPTGRNIHDRPQRRLPLPPGEARNILMEFVRLLARRAADRHAAAQPTELPKDEKDQ